MVLYSFKAVIAFLNQIQKIQGRPTFGSLWHLAQVFYDALCKLDHVNHPTDGWSGYLMTKEKFALRSATTWTHPEVVGKFFIIPITAITTGHQEQAKGDYKYKKRSPISTM